MGFGKPHTRPSPELFGAPLRPLWACTRRGRNRTSFHTRRRHQMGVEHHRRKNVQSHGIAVLGQIVLVVNRQEHVHAGVQMIQTVQEMILKHKSADVLIQMLQITIQVLMLMMILASMK